MILRKETETITNIFNIITIIIKKIRMNDTP